MPREIIRRQLAEVLEALPPLAFGRNPTDNSLVLIKRGEEGYYPLAPTAKLPQVKSNEDPTDAAALNAAIGVTPAQALAMVNGSMFGFDCPGADPLNCKSAERDVTYVSADRNRH